ncbi:hypothetical protein [Streptomyces sp. NPDC088246]|uniref:hypothetical protein n=1 Tax=Streptomyces sp. NPDC088246 TaxID=3365842 RepID=UPI0037F201C0
MAIRKQTRARHRRDRHPPGRPLGRLHSDVYFARAACANFTYDHGSAAPGVSGGIYQ